MSRRARLAVPAAAAVLALATLAATSFGATGDIELASVNGKGEPLDRRTGLTSISADGRYVAFTIDLGFQPGCCAPESDVWVYDRKRDRGERVSGGVRDRSWQFDGSISADGRYVAFVSSSERLVKRKTDGRPGARGSLDIFVYDRKRERTELISRDRGRRADRRNISPAISADGRYVAFASNSDDLGTGDEGLVRNRDHLVYVFDRKRKRTELVSKAPDGEIAEQDAWEPSLSADGSYVSYYSSARNLLNSAADGDNDVFRYDSARDRTELVSVPSGPVGPEPPGPEGSEAYRPAISNDGSRVAFELLVRGQTSEEEDAPTEIMVRDFATGETMLASTPLPGSTGAGGESTAATISGDGRYVGFVSEAANLVADDAGGVAQIYRRDLELGSTELVSRSSSGEPANEPAEFPALSADGRFLAFVSKAENLGRNGKRVDTFVADLGR